MNRAKLSNAPLANRAALDDPALWDVVFSDPRNGWAVGDSGVIWNTNDGGHTWRPQNSGTTARLNSVAFIDSRQGWAVGGDHQPFTHAGQGVLIRTRDGGQTWEQDSALLLPPLRHITFFGNGMGWAVGESSAVFPVGAFFTDSGGRSWMPSPTGPAQDFNVAAFVDPHTGAAAGRRGALAVIRSRALEPTATPDIGLRNVRAMKLSAPAGGWLVGDGGLVMKTSDAGKTWQLPENDPALITKAEFDWRGVETRGEQCWIVGSPGSRVFHTADGGKTWESFTTGQQLPLHDVCFVDDQNGFAVGAMGVIISTHDAGRTWQRRHSGAGRAAILALVGRPADIPFEALAQLCGNDGYLGHVHVLNRTDLEGNSAAELTLDDRTHDAVVLAGASGADAAWQFPVRASVALVIGAQQQVAFWDRLTDNHALERMEAHLTRQIRLWRPDVLFTHGPNRRGDDPLSQFVHQIVLRSVESAADPTRFPEQLGVAGLEAWKVRKVIGAEKEGLAGEFHLSTAQLAPQMGKSLADVTMIARGLIAQEFTPSPVSQGYSLLVDAVPQGAGRQDFMSGVVLYPGGEARRMRSDAPEVNPQLIQQMAQKQRNLKAILGMHSSDPDQRGRMLMQLGELTAELDAVAAADVTFELVEHYRRQGHWTMAAEAMQQYVERFPDHPLSAYGMTWLIQCLSSGEVAYQSHRPAKTPAGQPGVAPERKADGFVPPHTLGQVMPASGQLAFPSAPLAAPAELLGEARWEQAATLSKMLEQRWPALFAEPRVQFPLVKVARQRGLPRDADRFLLGAARMRPHDAWWSCAALETWLTDSQGQPPKAIQHVARFSSKPRLDGKLDDAVWRRARPAPLQSVLRDDEQWPAMVLLAYDDEFLYIAGEARKAPGVSYPKSSERRPRDPDLTMRDRVEVLLDVDRDWSTHYRFVVDHRGWVAEDCWGAKAFDPEWFVAATDQPDVWSFEAAIPWIELRDQRPEPQSAWAVGLQRVVPGLGFQSWTVPASADIVPEGFGLLWFE